MANTDDMSKPVTHAQLRDALAENNKLLLAEVRQIVAREVAQVVAREVSQVVAREVSHAAKSSDESTRSYMGALLDKASANDEALDAKYSDLPGRVTRLETAVFPPKRQRRR